MITVQLLGKVPIQCLINSMKNINVILFDKSTVKCVCDELGTSPGCTGQAAYLDSWRKAAASL